MNVQVHSKGQITIPVQVRKALGIREGERLEVRIDTEHGRIELSRVSATRSETLAGSLSPYMKDKKFPTQRRMQEALQKGLCRDSPAD